MATVVRCWHVQGTSLKEISHQTPAEQGLIEESLEDWLASEPDAIDDNLLIIGRQVTTGSGPLDLLAMTLDGDIVVVELKRDRAPRETVAQAVDYASWVASLDTTDVHRIAREYLKEDLAEAFHRRFGQTLPELQIQRPRILVVASRLDASTERMIEWLSREYQVDVDGLVFRHIRLPSGEQVLIRTSVVPEQARATSSESYRVSEAMLIELAREHHVLPVLEVLRTANKFLFEEAVKTYSGSFRYWGGGRMLCGVNTANYWNAPERMIDVWVSHGHWSQVSGIDEAELIKALESGFEIVKRYEGSHQIVLRVKSAEDAHRFVDLLGSWYGEEGDDDASLEDLAERADNEQPGATAAGNRLARIAKGLGIDPDKCETWVEVAEAINLTRIAQPLGINTDDYETWAEVAQEIDRRRDVETKARR